MELHVYEKSDQTRKQRNWAEAQFEPATMQDRSLQRSNQLSYSGPFTLWLIPSHYIHALLTSKQ